MTFAGIAAGVEFYRIDPTHEDPTGRSVNAVHAKRANALLGWMTSLIAERPDLAPKVLPDYPALGKRVLQDDGSWLRCLQRPNVELVHTAIDRVVADGILTMDGTHYAADVICYATGFRHNDYLASMDLTGRNGTYPARPMGRRTDRLPRHHHPQLPELVLRVRPRNQSAAGASLFYHLEFQVHYAMEAIHETLVSGARRCEITPEAHASYARRYQDEVDQLVWSHPSIAHSHYKNPAGKVYTLSPWPLDLYWEWTRHVDRNHYTFV